MNRFRWIKRMVVSIPLLAVAGCGESTEIPLAKVAPVTPAPNAPRKVTRRGISPSPDVLPGQSR